MAISTCLRAAIIFIVVLFSLVFLVAVDLPQMPLNRPSAPADRNYSVGIHLASTYGAAAVIVEGPGEDDRKTLTWVAYGSARYQETMARLSLESSEHWAPPYPGMQDYFIDIARVSIRRARKRAGLPASADVGALATVVLELRHQIDGVEVATTRASPYDVGGDGDGQVGLAGAGAADQDDVAMVGQEGAVV